MMARVIAFTADHMKLACSDFLRYLQTGKFPDGKISFQKVIGAIDQKAELHFSEKAWIKMQTLIREFDKEVAWHGTAYRGEDPEKNDYYIGDILVYPQEVSGATVNTDQAKYEDWLYDLGTEEFNNLRMQGHSHVNMGTSPSSVDLSHQERILEQIEGDMFYIFLIWNKRDERCIKIYDMMKNILFESSDVKVIVDDDGIGLDSFMKNAKSIVKAKSYNSSVSTQATTTAAAVQKPAAAAAPKEPEKKQENKKPELKVRKGHRKIVGGSKTVLTNACEEAEMKRWREICGYDPETGDPDDDPYSAFGYC